MEDIMHIQSLFLRRVVSAAIGKAIQKAGCKANVLLNDMRVTHADKNKNVRVYSDIDAEISEAELVNLLEKAGIV